VREHTCHTSIDPVWVEGDETRIEQIVMNLVGNALKFTPASGEIYVQVLAQGEHAVLRVADSGEGIAPICCPVSSSCSCRATGP
jgi:signal transduction histidine kinase